jgi:hypothetical protein
LSRKIYKGKEMESVFTWENNMLKFYLEFNAYKACDYGAGLLEDRELMDAVPQIAKNDLLFSTGVSCCLDVILIDRTLPPWD